MPRRYDCCSFRLFVPLSPTKPGGRISPCRPYLCHRTCLRREKEFSHD